MTWGKAFVNFFEGRTNYPKFKKKGKSHDSFFLRNDKVTIGSQWISIPGLGRFLTNQREQAIGQTINGRAKARRKLGTVNLAEKLRFSGKILGATVSHHVGWWYVSIQVEVQTQQQSTSESIVGIGVGLKTYISRV